MTHEYYMLHIHACLADFLTLDVSCVIEIGLELNVDCWCG